MSRKIKSQAIKQQAPPQGKPKSIVLYAIIVLVITALVFAGVSKLGWTNWDDDVYILENQIVQKGDLSDIFLQPSANTYNPIVVLSWALEWKKFGDDPFIYHLNNLLLHLACTFIVILILRRMGLDPLWAAFAGLFFGIHPLRVESVAWITERKDVVYALFYLWAILTYLKYLDDKKRIYLLFTFLLFTLSLFSKIQAVTLAPTLLLLDWYKKRPINLKVIAEKIPFIIGAIIIGLIGLRFLKEGNVVNLETEQISFANRFVLGFYAYGQYLIKLLVPYITSTYYPEPTNATILHYALCIASLAIIIFAVLKREKYRTASFAIGFFTLHIILLLQILAAGTAFMADRFTYVAYLGPIFMLGLFLQNRVKQNPNFRIFLITGSILLLSVFANASIKYISVWKDSDTLWSDVIEKYPNKIVLSYVNRGHYLRRNKENERAFADFNTAISLKKDYFLGYLNRGNIYFDRNEDEKAKQDYLKCLSLKSNMDTSGKKINTEAGEIYGNLGAIYGKIGKIDSSLYYLNVAIKAEPQNKSYYRNRALAYLSIGRYDESTRDFETCLKIDPNDLDIINSIGVNFLRQKRNAEAIAYFNDAIAKNSNQGIYYMNRSFAYANLNDKGNALKDALRAQQLKYTVDSNYLKSLKTP